MTGPELAGCNTRPGERGDPISRLPSRAGTVPAFLGRTWVFQGRSGIALPEVEAKKIG